MTKKPTDAEMVFFLCPFASLSPWFSSSILVSLSYSSSSSSSLYSCFSALLLVLLLSYISFLFVLLICFIFLLALLLVPSPSFFPFLSPPLHSSPAVPSPPSFFSFLPLPTRIIVKESNTTRKGREKWEQRTVTQPHPPLNKRTNKHTNKTKHPSKTT